MDKKEIRGYYLSMYDLDELYNIYLDLKADDYTLAGELHDIIFGATPVEMNIPEKDKIEILNNTKFARYLERGAK